MTKPTKASSETQEKNDRPMTRKEKLYTISYELGITLVARLGFATIGSILIMTFVIWFIDLVFTLIMILKALFG